MTPYTDRRAQGFYNEKGEKPQSTTTDQLGGLVGTGQKAEPNKTKKA